MVVPAAVAKRTSSYKLAFGKNPLRACIHLQRNSEKKYCEFEGNP